MPITFDSSGQGSNNNTTSLTVSHTVGVGEDRALYVYVASDDATDDLAGATVTYGGTSLGAPIATVSAGGTNWLYLWRMTAPPSGTANIVISSGANMYLQCISSSWFGVDQATSNGTITTYNVINGTSPRVLSVTAQAGGVVVDFLHRRQVASPLTPDVTQTRIGTEISAVVGTSGSSYKTADGATSMTWTHTSGSISVTHMAVPLNPTAAGASFAGTVTLDDAAPGGSFATASASSFAGAVTMDNAAPGGGFGPAPGTFTSPPLNSNNGTALVSAPLSYVAAYDATTGALVARFTGLTTDSLGRFTVSSALLSPGATLRWDWETAAGQRRMPLGVVA